MQTKEYLTRVASETVQILEAGQYRNQRGALVSLSDMLKTTIYGTVLYRPGELLNVQLRRQKASSTPQIDVTGETTTEAGKRLVDEGCVEVVVLNFASAKNPGGGFLRGTKAQEEDLARRSGLYASLAFWNPHCKACNCEKDGQTNYGLHTCPREYYAANKRSKSSLYTDHLIYSPQVPFFRDENLQLMEAPYPLSVITCPAPNAGEAKGARPLELRYLLEGRARDILTAAVFHGHRNIVLGAWGCGVFRNDPTTVAKIFSLHLRHETFRNAFDKVTFAVYDTSPDKATLKAFLKVFPEGCVKCRNRGSSPCQACGNPGDPEDL